MKDSQKNLVYSWEDKFISQKDITKVPFSQVQSIINYIWDREALKYPPTAYLLPKNTKTKAGDATRTIVRFKEETYTWIILHELAHSMSSLPDGNSNYHGSIFVGIYMQLLHRYLHIPLAYLIQTAESCGLKFDINAKPAFLL